MKKLKIGQREGPYRINPDRTGIFVYNYKDVDAFFCIAKIFKFKDKDKIGIESRKLTSIEGKRKNTANYVRINAGLLPKLIEVLQEFQKGGKEVVAPSKEGKEDRELEELIRKVGF